MSRLQQVDFAILSFIKKYHLRLARAALFLVYFWFGALKLFGASPANPLVASLLERTLPFLSFQQFIVVFALFEMLIGILFLLPGWERLLGLLLAVHLLTTFLPLLLLPAVTWQGFLVPTLEGQYIIKNVLIIALALAIVSPLDFLREKVRPERK